MMSPTYSQKVQKKYAYVNMWIEKDKENGGKWKQWMNLDKGHMGVLCTIFDILLCFEIYQNLKLLKNQL